MHNENNKRAAAVRQTSKESFAIITESGKALRHKQKVLEAITKHQPVTSRFLSDFLSIERISICKPLYDLVHETNPKIKEAFVATCPISGRKVIHYALIDYKHSL